MENQNQINQRFLDILREEAKRHGKRFNKNLSLSIGKDSGTISNLLSGKRTASDEMKEKILKALGKDLSDLLSPNPTDTETTEDEAVKDKLIKSLELLVEARDREIEQLKERISSLENIAGPGALPTGTL